MVPLSVEIRYGCIAQHRHQRTKSDHRNLRPIMLPSFKWRSSRAPPVCLRHPPDDTRYKPAWVSFQFGSLSPRASHHQAPLPASSVFIKPFNIFIRPTVGALIMLIARNDLLLAASSNSFVFLSDLSLQDINGHEVDEFSLLVRPDSSTPEI